MGLATSHSLRQEEDRRARTCAAEMPECSVYERQHAVREEILLEEFRAVDLPLDERIEAQYCSSPVCNEYRLAGLAERLNAHISLGPLSAWTAILRTIVFRELFGVKRPEPNRVIGVAIKFGVLCAPTVDK